MWRSKVYRKERVGKILLEYKAEETDINKDDDTRLILNIIII